MNELDKREAVELSEESLDSVLGGVDFNMSNDSVTISWEAGEKMNSIWSVVDGYASILREWGLSVDAVKNYIKAVAQEHLKAGDVRWTAKVSGKVTITKTGGIF